MHQRAQRLGDLGWPVRVGVDLARAIKITAEVLAAQLMGQLTDVGGVVEVVAVVPDDRLGEVGEDEGFEGVQVAVAEQIVRVEPGGAAVRRSALRRSARWRAARCAARAARCRWDSSGIRSPASPASAGDSTRTAAGPWAG